MDGCQHYSLKDVEENRDGDVVRGWLGTCIECGEQVYRRNEHWDNYIRAQSSRGSSGTWSTYSTNASKSTTTGPAPWSERVQWWTPLLGAAIGALIGYIGGFLYREEAELSPGYLAVVIVGISVIWYSDTKILGYMLSCLRAVIAVGAIVSLAYLEVAFLPYVDNFLRFGLYGLANWLVAGAIVWTILALLWPHPTRRHERVGGAKGRQITKKDRTSRVLNRSIVILCLLLPPLAVAGIFLWDSSQESRNYFDVRTIPALQVFSFYLLIATPVCLWMLGAVLTTWTVWGEWRWGLGDLIWEVFLWPIDLFMDLPCSIQFLLLIAVVIFAVIAFLNSLYRMVFSPFIID